MIRRVLLSLLLVPLLSCGNSPTATVFIRLADGISQNILSDIAGQMDTVYRGIYFEFRELSGCPPASINSTVDPTGATVALTFPGTDQPGATPLQSTFTIDTSGLKKNVFYQVRMLAAKISGEAPPYEGIADCPLYLGLEGQNRIVICFGVAGAVARNCIDTIPYANCTVPVSCFAN
jgi:hypothetical protein